MRTKPRQLTVLPRRAVNENGVNVCVSVHEVAVRLHQFGDLWNFPFGVVFRVGQSLDAKHFGAEAGEVEGLDDL